MIEAILTDIEGTTSSIAFVHEVLFPYSQRELPSFLRARATETRVAVELDKVRSELQEPAASLAELLLVLERWIVEDRKLAPLKALQGMVWEHGYRSGALRSHVFADAAQELRVWHGSGIALPVYSSGSVQAQKLLFEFSDQGDLRALFSGYFDTEMGAKRQTASYRNILTRIEERAGRVLFLSDTPEELDAAAAAGIRCCELRRDERPACGRHPVAADFPAVTEQFALCRPRR